MKNFDYTNVTILGAARSGLAAAHLLRRHGVRVFVSDQAPARPEVLAALEEAGIESEFGGHSSRALKTGLMILSPGIPVRSAIVQQFYQAGIPVLSEIEVAWQFCPANIIAVTGSNGKTTTATLIGHMLETVYPGLRAAGNIGQPFSDLADTVHDGEWLAIEVSSFQLETIRDFHPQAAVVLNFAPNHLDRYDSYEDYITAKWRVTKNLNEEDRFIFNADDPLLSTRAAALHCRKMAFGKRGRSMKAAYFDETALYIHGKKIIDRADMKLRGEHNYNNALAAALAANYAGVPQANITLVLREFEGVEHRLEFVAEKNGVRFVNDSKATTLESLEVALKSFDKPVVLIAGGKDKGSDFFRLGDLVGKQVKHLVLIGSATEKIAAAWQDKVKLSKAGSLPEAVNRAAEVAAKGDTVLLSPACASFDMFQDYEDRGRQFKKIVENL